MSQTARSIRPRLRVVVALGLSCLTAPPVAHGALNRWSGNGPGGGDVIVAVADPAVPATLYAGTTGGLFRSTDSGATWKLAASAFAGVEVDAVLVPAASPTLVLVGTARHGIFRSTDRGLTFAPANGGIPDDVHDLTITAFAADPANASRLWACADSFLAGAGGPLLSTNGGVTWTVKHQGLSVSSGVFDLVIDPFDANRLFVAVRGAGLYRSTDGGDSWQSDNAGLGGAEFEDLAVVPFDAENPTGTAARTVTAGNAATVVATNREDPLLKRLRDGAELAGRLRQHPFATHYFDALLMFLEESLPWKGLPQGRPAASPTAATPLTHVMVDTENGTYGTTDLGNTWVQLGVVPDVHAFSQVRDSAGDFLAATRGAGVYASTNFGKTWTAKNQGLDATDVRDLAFDPKVSTTLFAATNGFGVQRTTDAGRNWTARNQGLPADLVVAAVAVDPTNGNTVWAGTANGVYRSVSAGASWNRRSTGLDSACVDDLLVDPQTPSTVWAGTCDLGVFRSTNSGASWQAVNTGLPSTRIHQLALGGGAPRTLWAATGNGIARSTDGGTTWTSGAAEPRLHDHEIDALAVDPTNPLVLYAARQQGGLWKTTNGGSTWSELTNGLSDPQTSEEAVIDALAVDPTSPQTVYAATLATTSTSATAIRGVLRSTNGGSSWTPLADGVYGLPTHALAIDPLRSGTVYTGTGAAGVRQLTVGSAGPCVANATTLCLRNNRFEVKVDWQRLDTGQKGLGSALPLTTDTGAFWFFDAANVELIVKVLDGTGVNGKFWVFYGALSNVQYTLTVIDHTTGEVRTYVNPQGNQASVADVNALAASASPAPAGSEVVAVSADEASVVPACTATATKLCLRNGRFAVTVDWVEPRQLLAGDGKVLPFSDDTGMFWFFSPQNIELVVKILDGRSLNGHFWVFFGALSDVIYNIHVTDLTTGAQKTYSNPAGTLASRADVTAF